MHDDANGRRIIRHDPDAYIRYNALQQQIRPELVRARRHRKITAAVYLTLLALVAIAAAFLTR